MGKKGVKRQKDTKKYPAVLTVLPYHLKNLGLKVHLLAGCHERGKLT